MKNKEIREYVRSIKKELKINSDHHTFNLWLSLSISIVSFVWMIFYYFYLVDIPGTEFSYRLGEFLKNVIPSAFLTAIFYLVISWLPMRKEKLRNDRLIASIKNGGSYSINTIIDKVVEYLTLLLLPDMIDKNHKVRKQKLMVFDCSLQNVCRTLNSIERSQEDIRALNKVCDEIRCEVKFFINSFDGNKNQPLINILIKLEILLPRMNPNKEKKDFVLMSPDFYHILLLYIFIDKNIGYMNNYIYRIPDITSLL